jgi:hypothetical protein
VVQRLAGPLTVAACRLALSLAWMSAGILCGADLPAPEQVGFHHCALIYERKARTSDDLLPYVVRVEGSRPRAWLFDAFLFLHFTAKSGVRTDAGATTRSDWEYQLDTWFAPDRDLRALDEAIGRAARALGEPAKPRQVLLTMPYPNPSVRDFGMLPGGSSPDLASIAGVRAAAAWYVSEAQHRFRKAGYRHLRLWGIYWMREEMPAGDEPRVTAAANVVHQAGLRFAWIPWWRAPGFDRWRTVGFDVAFLQPNYAFHSWTHGGSVRRNRLAAAADLARQHGLGLEMEAGAVLESEADRHAALHYLADGHRDRLNYQHSAMAYFLSTDTVERSSASPTREGRTYYEALAQFIGGHRVADPDPTLDVRPEGAAWTARLDRQRYVSRLDILIDEEPEDAWQGTVEALVRSQRGGAWQPGGWTIRAGADSTSGRRQVITVPIGRRAREIMLRLKGSRALQAGGARVIPEALETEAPIPHAALGSSYRCSKPSRGIYNDDGTKLTDGIEAVRGFSEGRSVGWMAPSVAVQFDLGRARSVERVEVVCQGGSYGAVNWPAEAVLMLSEDRPLSGLSQYGPLPMGLHWVAGSKPEVVRRRSASDLDGVIRFTVEPVRTVRWLTLAFRPSGWLMLSEISVFSDGTNIAGESGVRYDLRPLPTPTPEALDQYADDGIKLTDGFVASTLNRTLVTGWSDGEPRTFEVDLKSSTPVASVIVWSLRGGLHGIYAPEQVAVLGSDDGGRWTELGLVHSDAGEEDGKSCVAAPFRLKLGAPRHLRYLRIVVRPKRGWAMLSEIEVRSDGTPLR